MSCLYSYTSELPKCPYPDCEKAIEVPIITSERPVGQGTCQHCGRPYMVKIASYKTTTLETPFE